MAKEPNLQLAEDEDLERARTFWNENGRSIVAGVLLGILAIGGWNGWQYWQKSDGENASTLYENLRSGDMAPSAAAELAEDLMSDYPESPYAINAAFVLAKKSVDTDDFDQAKHYLQWALENASDEGLTHISRLRLAQVHFADNEPEEALRILNQGGTALNQGPFAARYQELIGDAEAEMGNEESARKAWESSLEHLNSNDSSARLVELKLENLGRL